MVNRDDDVAVRVGIFDVVDFCWAAVAAAVAALVVVRPAFSLSIFKLMGIGEVRSDTLRRFGNGVMLGELDVLLFLDDLLRVGVNFFNCSIRCVGLLI